MRPPVRSRPRRLVAPARAPRAIRARIGPLACVWLALACRAAPAPGSTARAEADTTLIRRDIAHLASDALEGRGTGTAGNDSAALYIARRYRALGLEARGDGDARPCLDEPAPAPRTGTRAARSRAHCPGEYLQRFEARSVVAAHAGRADGLPTQNVVAVLPGSDPALRGQYVVIGAHFDHLGRASFGALDPGAADAIRNGADDNASGTAAVMALARRFAARPPRRSVIFATFSAEELGLIGSRHFVENPPVPLDSVVAMLNFDMVGRLRDDKLIVNGVETATEMRAILDSANTEPRLDVRALGGGFGPSDHASFYLKGIPVLHFFTDLHADYHRATDDAERVNVAGVARVVDYAERVARAIADRPARLSVVRTAARPRVSSTAEGERPYLGTVPDMGASVSGVRLSGVNADSPGGRAGLRAGDVIVELDGKGVTDLESYSAALYARKPGDTVQIVVLRDGQRVTVEATLGKRGS